MRKLNILKSLALAAVTLVIVVVGVLAVQIFVLGASGITSLAATGGGIIDGTVTTTKVDAKQADLNLDYVSQKITEMRPSATPLDTIVRSIAKTVPVNSIKTDFYAVDIKPFKDATTAAFTNAGTATTAELTVGNISIWSVDDTLMIPGVVGGDGLPLVGCVTAKNVGTNKITIQALNGTGAQTAIVPNVASGKTLVRMAPAKSELDAQHSPFAIIPEKDFNYCQNYMAQIEASTFDKIQAKEVDWDFSDYEELSIYDMKSAIERTSLFGIRKMFTDATDADVKYTCGGLNSFMTKGLEWSGTTGINNTVFTNWLKSMFQDNSGSDNRVLFAGDNLLAAMANVDLVNKQLEAKNTEVRFGITFNVIESNWGKLYVKRHPMFRMMDWEDNGLILDINNIEKHVHTSLTATKLELKKSGIRNADATVLQEVSCPILRYPGTHARILKTA